MEMENIIRMLNMIGPAGIVLVFAGFAAVYLVLKNSIYLYLVSRDFRKEVEEGRLSEDQLRSYMGSNPMIDIIQNVTLVHGSHSEDLRAEVAYLFHRNFEKVEKSMAYIKLISVISPLLGLLGTMLGMVGMFRVLAVKTAPDPALLAGGIWEALLTTIEGLCIAIPALFFHYSLGLRLKGFRIEAVEYSYQAKNLMTRNREDGIQEKPGQSRADASGSDAGSGLRRISLI